MESDFSLSAILEAVLLGGVVNPGIISVNFTAGAWPLRRRSAAGAVWNNIENASGTAVPLRDSAGNATTARLTFASASSYAEFGAPKTLNAAINRLYRGGLVGNDTIREVQVSITDIPYPLYDVFVFASADTTDRSPLSITDGQTTFYYRSAGQSNGQAGRLLRTGSEDSSAPTEGPAQYQVFLARTDPTVTLTTGGSRHCVLSNNVFGLQIVQALSGEAMSETRKKAGAPRNQVGPCESENPPCSELHLPFEMGSVVRVRYRGHAPDSRLGGGALNIYSGPDIALHVNPRPKLHALVLNSHIQGGWGGEERPAGYPLAERGEICLSVWAGPEGFFIQARTSKGEVPFCYLYAYRLPEERKLDRLTIDLPDVRAITVQPEL